MLEWKKLGEICVSLKKEIIKQDNLVTNGKYPVVNSGVTLYGRYNECNNNGNAFTFASRGEYAGFLTYMSEDFWAGGLCYPYRSQDEEKYLTKFIYEYLKSQELYIMDRLVARGGIPALNKADVEKIQIPVPSLSEQSRIVGILDTFTASIENLKQQIAQRRKQYEHYRDQLLDLEGKEGVEMKALGEVCDLITGGEVPDNTNKGQLQPTEDHPYAVYTNGKEVYGFSNTYQVDADTVCISSIGANTGAIFYKTGRFTPAIRLKVLLPKEGLIPKYLFYACSKIDFRGRNTGSVPNINANYVKGRKLFVPSFAEQQRIVSILDTFEASIANLEQQLAQRERQYEYYRNKLLTFE